MAIETTTVEIISDLERYRIDTFASFGWQLVSSKPADYDRDMVILTFSRDTEMHNFEKINSIFELYLQKEEKAMELTKQQVAMGNAPQKLIFNKAVFLLLFFAIPGAIGLICYTVSFNAKNKKREKEIEEYYRVYNALDNRVKDATREFVQLIAKVNELL